MEWRRRQQVPKVFDNIHRQLFLPHWPTGPMQYNSPCVNILMMAPFSIYDACPGKSGQWWWVQRGCRPSVPAAWICAQSALEHDSMQAIGPGAHSEAGQMSTSVLLTWPHWPSPSVTWAMTAIDHRDYWREHLLQQNSSSVLQYTLSSTQYIHVMIY